MKKKKTRKEMKIINLKDNSESIENEKEVDSSKVIKKCISEVYLNSLMDIEELIKRKNG